MVVLGCLMVVHVTLLRLSKEMSECNNFFEKEVSGIALLLVKLEILELKGQALV